MDGHPSLPMATGERLREVTDAEVDAKARGTETTEEAQINALLTEAVDKARLDDPEDAGESYSAGTFPMQRSLQPVFEVVGGNDLRAQPGSKVTLAEIEAWLAGKTERLGSVQPSVIREYVRRTMTNLAMATQEIENTHTDDVRNAFQRDGLAQVLARVKSHVERIVPDMLRFTDRLDAAIRALKENPQPE